MPELPEVETVKNVLEPQIKGMQIEAVSVRCPDVIAHPAADDFCTCLIGQHILDMTRRGKFLNIRLESGDRIVLHLRMTGMQKLGPEPFDHLTAAYLQAKLGRRRKAIKECLLDQTVIAGIGPYFYI